MASVCVTYDCIILVLIYRDKDKRMNISAIEFDAVFSDHRKDKCIIAVFFIEPRRCLIGMTDEKPGVILEGKFAHLYQHRYDVHLFKVCGVVGNHNQFTPKINGSIHFLRTHSKSCTNDLFFVVIVNRYVRMNEFRTDLMCYVFGYSEQFGISVLKFLKI